MLAYDSGLLFSELVARQPFTVLKNRHEKLFLLCVNVFLVVVHNVFLIGVYWNVLFLMVSNDFSKFSPIGF